MAVGGGPELPRTRAERFLRDLLTSMEPGQRLPSVADLAASADVSVGTMAAVLRKLANEGQVTILRAYGSYKALQ